MSIRASRQNSITAFPRHVGSRSAIRITSTRRGARARRPSSQARLMAVGGRYLWSIPARDCAAGSGSPAHSPLRKCITSSRDANSCALTPGEHASRGTSPAHASDLVLGAGAPRGTWTRVLDRQGRTEYCKTSRTTCGGETQCRTRDAPLAIYFAR